MGTVKFLLQIKKLKALMFSSSSSFATLAPLIKDYAAAPLPRVPK